MKLILNETQYQRLFNNKKRKLVISESQYKRLILEGKSSGLASIEVFDVLHLISKSNDVLYFKVIDKSNKGLILINCNDGVHKNAYFLLDPLSLDGSNITYKSAQNKDIKDKSNPWDSVENNPNAWRVSTFKDVKGIKVYKDSGEGASCNISDKPELKFEISLESGAPLEPEVEEDDDDTKSKLCGEQGVCDVWVMGQIKDWKLNNDYSIEIEDGGRVDIKVRERNSTAILIEILKVSGNEGMRFEELVGEILQFDLTPKSVVMVDDFDGEKPPIYNLKFKFFTGGGEDGEGGEVKAKSEEKELFHVVDFYETASIPGVDFVEPSAEEIEEFFKEYIQNSELLQKAIYEKPNWFLDMIGSDAAKGLVLANSRLEKWVGSVKLLADKVNQNGFLKEFKPGTEVLGKFIQLNTNEKDSRGREQVVFVSRVQKMSNGDKYAKLLTNFDKTTDIDEQYLYKVSIIKKIEDSDSAVVYSVALSSRNTGSGKFTKIGDGKYQIKKEN